MNKLKSGMVIALSVASSAGALAGSVQAETTPSKKLHKHIATKKLEKRTLRQLRDNQQLAHYNGTLVVSVTTNTGASEAIETAGGTPSADTAETRQVVRILNPELVFRGNPKGQFGHDDLENGDYAFGSIDDTKRKANIDLTVFNPNTMYLQPNLKSSDPEVVNAAFLPLKGGGFDFNTPINHNGDVMVNGFGEPIQIGEKHVAPADQPVG